MTIFLFDKQKVMKAKRRYPIGAEFSKAGVDFRVWASDHSEVTLILEDENKQVPLENEKNGYFNTFVPHLKKNAKYRFGLGSFCKNHLYPDPASRYQPFGVEGPSAVIDSSFPWTDDDWNGIQIEGQIIYELHIGTFTKEGTFSSAARQLSALADLGITVIEIMPLNEFPGRFGWGYDGTHLFSPYHEYGHPEELKAFINKAHQLKLGVILDVVYNHFGPQGNDFSQFSKDYLNSKKKTEWGDAINFDHPSSCEYFLTNARYWIEEFHFDGLRIDATPWFFCQTQPHILSQLSRVIEAANPKKKKIIIAESEKQDITLLRPYEEGGYQFDAIWNDDFHHTALVRLKGKREAYYTDYTGSPQEFISSLKYGFLYQGQYYSWQKQKRGSFHLSLPHSSKIVFLENHDQVANTGTGKRLHQLSDPGNYRALTALLLLGPNIPMLFQGQEFGSSSPFYYFADHQKKLSSLVYKGRKKFLAQFPSLSTKEAQQILVEPADLNTFLKCKLDFNERSKNHQSYRLHKDLIKLRKEIHMPNPGRWDGAVLSHDAFLIHYSNDQYNYLIIVNFGTDFTFNPISEPLLASGDKKDWKMIWCSDAFIYGGEGIKPHIPLHWNISGHSTAIYKIKKSRVNR